MRRGLSILLLGLILGGSAYAVVSWAGAARARALRASSQPELAWLADEFHLSDAELGRIEQMHQAYLPQCRQRCARVREINDEMEKALATAATVTPQISDLLRQRAQLRSECQTAMLAHFLAVSQAMPPAEGRRYLDWVNHHTCLNDPSMMSVSGANNPPAGR